jgi:hypothetical protein
MQGRVAMVLTSPHYGPSTHGHVEKRPDEGVLKYDTGHSTDPANLAYAATAISSPGSPASSPAAARCSSPAAS